MTSRTQYAILGLLALGPKSGYDVKKETETVLAHFWNESYGSIYPMLRRMTERCWIEKAPAASDQSGHPGKTLYRITPEGEEVLRDWFREPIEMPKPRVELLLKVFFGRFAPEQALLEQVGEVREKITGQLARVEAVNRQLEAEVEAARDPDPDAVCGQLTVSLGLHVYRAWLAWCAEAMPRLESLERERKKSDV